MSFTDDMFKSLEKSISNEITKDAKKELKKAVGKGLSALTGDDVKITSKGSGGKQTVTTKSKKSSSSKSSSTAKAQAQAAKDDAKAAKEAAEQQKESGIQGMIELCQDMGGTPDVAKQRIMDSFSLSDKQAREYIDKYWKVEEEPEPEPEDEAPAAQVQDTAAEASPSPEDIASEPEPEPEPDPVPDAIQAMINTCKDFGTTRDDARQRIASTFSLSEDEASDYVDRVWPE